MVKHVILIFVNYFSINYEHIHHNLLNEEDYQYVERFNNLVNIDKITFIMIQLLYLLGNYPNNEKCIKLCDILIKKFGNKINYI